MHFHPLSAKLLIFSKRLCFLTEFLEIRGNWPPRFGGKEGARPAPPIRRNLEFWRQKRSGDGRRDVQTFSIFLAHARSPTFQQTPDVWKTATFSMVKMVRTCLTSVLGLRYIEMEADVEEYMMYEGIAIRTYILSVELILQTASAKTCQLLNDQRPNLSLTVV